MAKIRWRPTAQPVEKRKTRTLRRPQDPAGGLTALGAAGIIPRLSRKCGRKAALRDVIDEHPHASAE
ncbi:MAG: hypothetical protein GXC76_14955 [Rhodanobacteraceae bacterium]|nr:hypothetical protein [Rhodanobacteraceae bacterium]